VASELTKRATAETAVKASPVEVARTIKETFGTMGIFYKRQNIDEKADWIELHGERREFTLRSWGEKVKIEIIGDGTGGSVVRAESKAWLPTTIFDYGQNKDNLKKLFTALITKYKKTSPLVIKEKTF
jgi:hypothetical protein